MIHAFYQIGISQPRNGSRKSNTHYKRNVIEQNFWVISSKCSEKSQLNNIISVFTVWYKTIFITCKTILNFGNALGMKPIRYDFHRYMNRRGGGVYMFQSVLTAISRRICQEFRATACCGMVTGL